MDKEYLTLQQLFVEKLEGEFAKIDVNPLSTEQSIKEVILNFCTQNKDMQMMPIDFLTALYEQDNTLDYIYKNAKDIPLSRLISKIAKDGVITLAETLELVGDDAYCEKIYNQRMQKVDGHAYFIRKPPSFDDLKEYTQTYVSRNSSQSSPYYVFKTIKMDAIKYDDFLNNRLGHTHKFIAENAEGCYENKYGILQCLRIRNLENPKQSVLIQSEGYDYARYVAIEKPKDTEPVT